MPASRLRGASILPSPYVQVCLNDLKGTNHELAQAVAAENEANAAEAVTVAVVPAWFIQ